MKTKNKQQELNSREVYLEGKIHSAKKLQSLLRKVHAKLQYLRRERKISEEYYTREKKKIFKEKGINSLESYYDRRIRQYRSQLREERKEKTHTQKIATVFSIFLVFIALLFMGFVGYTSYDTFVETIAPEVSESIETPVVETPPESSAGSEETESAADVPEEGLDIIPSATIMPVEEPLPEQDISLDSGEERRGEERRGEERRGEERRGDNTSDNFVPNIDEPIVEVPEGEVPLENITENINQTIENVSFSPDNVSVFIPIENITLPEINFTTNESIFINETNVSIPMNLSTQRRSALIQYAAVIGQPVGWNKNIVLDQEEINLEVEIPSSAEHVSVSEVTDNVEVDIDLAKVKVREDGQTKDIRSTKYVEQETIALSFFGGLFEKLFAFFKDMFAVTGYVIVDTSENTTLLIEEPVREVNIEYFTEAPLATEVNTSYGKEITISASLPYTNVLSYSSIPEVENESVMLYWIVNGTRQEHAFNTYDTNNNSLVDYIEWVTPHLSNQTFEIELLILDVQSYPTVGGNWNVRFNTTGTANLIISAYNGTTWSNITEDTDLKFLSVHCGEGEQSYSWINESVDIANYSCAETSLESSQVWTGGVHTLQFQFGHITKYAYNQAGGNISLLLIPNGTITVAELNHPNFSISVVYDKTGAYNISQTSYNVENSDRNLGVTHNKTSEVYIGDAIHFEGRRSGGSFSDVLYLNRIMFVYNISGTVKNISSANADSSSCAVQSNSSTMASVSCTVANTDVSMTSTFIATQNNTHPVMFYTVENKAAVAVTLIEYYSYLDCDATNKSGYQGRDDLISLIKHTSAADQEEQLSKEGYVVCDTKGLSPEAEISKCALADNDSFYVMQKVGSGTPNPTTDMFCGFSTKHTPTAQVNILAAFVNPSTDTDGLREVVPAKVVMSGNSPLDKSDMALVGNIEGTTLQPGELFFKYYGLIAEQSSTAFSRAVDENVSGVPLTIIDANITITNELNGSAVRSIGAYIPFNISFKLGNTLTENLTGIVHNCTVIDSNNVIVSQTNEILSIGAKEAVKVIPCGGSYNNNNTLFPGVYNISVRVKSQSLIERAYGNFTILSDHNGSLAVNLNKNLYKCNETVLINVNTTNIGNTNFTGNLSLNLYYTNTSFKEALVNYSDVLLIKNTGNISNRSYFINECSDSANFTVRANMSLSDGNDGSINLNQDKSYYNDNIYPSIVFSPGYENASAVFKRFYTAVNITDDYAIDSCILELKKGTTTTYNMTKTNGNCTLDINLSSNGNYDFRIIVNDTINNTNYTSFITIEKFTAPNLTKFSGANTTNVETDVRNAKSHSDFCLETSSGKICWLNAINIVDIDFASNADINDKLGYVAAANVHASLNSSADVYFYNMSSIVQARIFVNDSGNWKVCTKCTQKSFNRNAGILIFNTTSFSAFIGQEGTNLTIFDDSDSEGGSITRYANQRIGFFANYTNTSYAPVIGTGSRCDISFNNTGSWSAGVNTTYNATNKLYEYNRTYNQRGLYWYNMSCQSLTNANLSLEDNITLPNWIPTVPVVIGPLNGTSTTNRTPTFAWFNTTENDDLDNITYEFVLDNNSDFSSPITNITLNETSLNTSYTPTVDLEVDTTHYWRVRAYDGSVYTAWNTTRFDILSLVAISMPGNTVNFGTTGVGILRNTTEPGYSNLVVSSDSNVWIKISVNATNIFNASFSDTPGRYEFKITANETGAYNASTLSGWNNITGTEVLSIREFRYQNSSNTANRANLHMLIRVPSDQSAGALTSTVYIKAEAE